MKTRMCTDIICCVCTYKHFGFAVVGMRFDGSGYQTDNYRFSESEVCKVSSSSSLVFCCFFLRFREPATLCEFENQ